MGKCYDNGVHKVISCESTEEMEDTRAEYTPYFHRGPYGNPFEEIQEGAFECADDGKGYYCLHECCSHFAKGFYHTLAKREKENRGKTLMKKLRAGCSRPFQAGEY
ncbi:MAG: hypothetical protein K0R52_1389, partial [Alphaproteobacteria bacterium]|jgi:hypothetical protein|nr:hypothetical protein [Alphaproteobacteria bacterium]